MTRQTESSGVDHVDPNGRAMDRITAFYEEHQRAGCEPMTYLVFDLGGGNTYVLRPTRESVEWLADQLKLTSWKNRLGFVTLKTLSSLPRLLRFMPMVRLEPIGVSVEDPFDVAVIRDRITLLQFQEERAYKIALTDGAKIRDEIERRKQLPESINTPPILEYDDEYPYLVERQLDGRVLTDPITEWDRLLEVLDQLTDLYESDRRPTEIETAVRTVRNRLVDETHEPNPAVRAGFDLLETLDLPPTIYRGPVHGDLHAGNVFVNDSVYVLDWEDGREDDLIDDFFRPFVIHQYHESVQNLFVQMIRNEGAGGRILADYARTIGPTAYGDSKPYSGLALFYLLSLLTKTDADDSLYVLCHEMLSDVVSAFEEERLGRSESPSSTGSERGLHLGGSASRWARDP